MVELAIALSLLTVICIPFFYYGIFITDLAAWKSTLYINARDQSIGGGGKFWTFGRYVVLCKTGFESKQNRTTTVVSGESRVYSMERLPFIRSVKFPVKHEKYKEDSKTYKLRAFYQFIWDLVKGGWEELMNLVSSWWEQFSF